MYTVGWGVADGWMTPLATSWLPGEEGSEVGQSHLALRGALVAVELLVRRERLRDCMVRDELDRVMSGWCASGWH